MKLGQLEDIFLQTYFSLRANKVYFFLKEKNVYVYTVLHVF